MERVFAVTGAFGVLGRALTRRFMDAGDHVILIDRVVAGEALRSEFASELVLDSVDLGDLEGTGAAIARGVRHFGHLDGLINAAGGFEWEKLQEGSLDTWDRMYATNLRTAVVASKCVLPHLLKSGYGRIVNIGAAAAAKAAGGMGPYAASKAGVARLTESLAEEVKDRLITVNAVLPSILDTPRNRADMPDADFGRWVSPGAIAELVTFLCSEQAAAITGASIPVTNRC
ncbi:SDR family NAD(P)-dependent oxidoreductase [Scleromatobacter humisilvae]|uniref:SDR family NAD(P)-dependent oxidoreductase n=1 Tax=Scleromatobacter humisilvae TaxID=2897159 RepID=A0A9X1YIU1_9BURK|nr:SDR family NAD(P)-dependent oxidoreductase [Scleromatobacter humisilvae]MCK9685645.1 SDR family NAD(P)-dependent oxidoreductase [Scleromatobacter humisilvae]